MSELPLFGLLLLAHLAGDFLLQTKEAAQRKKKSFPALLFHGAVIFTASAALTAAFMPPGWLLVLIIYSLFHILVDKRRPFLYNIFGSLSGAADQALHVLSALGAAMAGRFV